MKKCYVLYVFYPMISSKSESEREVWGIYETKEEALKHLDDLIAEGEKGARDYRRDCEASRVAGLNFISYTSNESKLFDDFYSKLHLIVVVEYELGAKPKRQFPNLEEEGNYVRGSYRGFFGGKVIARKRSIDTLEDEFFADHDYFIDTDF